MKNKLVGAIFLLALMFGTTSFAQKPGVVQEKSLKHQQFSDNDQRGSRMENFLTEEQKDAFKAIRLKSMKETKPLRDELRELRAHQQTLMTADQPDLNTIYSNIDKMSTLEAQLAKVRAKSRIEMQSYLTDDQKVQFQHMKAMREREHKKNFKHRSFSDDKI